MRSAVTCSQTGTRLGRTVNAQGLVFVPSGRRGDWYFLAGALEMALGQLCRRWWIGERRVWTIRKVQARGDERRSWMEETLGARLW